MDSFLAWGSFMAGILATIGAFISVWQNRVAAQKGNPIVGESRWFERKDLDEAFCTLTIFPGDHFTQITRIEVPGSEIAPILLSPDKRLAHALRVQAYASSLQTIISLPVNSVEREVSFCVRPIPRPPFAVNLFLFRHKAPIVHRVDAA